MSVQELLQAALAAALREHPPLASVLTAIFDAPPARALRPYALVDETPLIDWSTKDIAGREGRVAILLYDRGERPTRLRALTGEVEAAIEDMPRAIGGGWRLIGPVLARSRIAREGEDRWMAMSEFQVRMLRTQ